MSTSVTKYNGSTSYKKYDIIYPPTDSTIYYYSILDHTSSTGTNSTGGTDGLSDETLSTLFNQDKNKWDGVLNVNGVNLPHFFWKPSYGTVTEFIPNLKKHRFGDKYYQRYSTNLNSTKLVLNLNFDNRNDKEVAAIAHFLTQRRGYENFVYIPPPPFSTFKLSFPKRFVCKKWRIIYNFKENTSIKATFEEVPRKIE